MHGWGHHCSLAKPATPLNIKLSVARLSASADDGSQMSSLLAEVAAPHAPVTNPRQGRRVDDVRDSCFRGGAGVRGANVNCRAWLISEARAVLLWLRSSCLDANEGHRSSGHLASISNVHKKLLAQETAEDRTCSSGDILADRQTDRQTRSSQYFASPTGGRRNNVSHLAVRCGLKTGSSQLYTSEKLTRSSAIAEGPRDASCQLKSCQLPRNSAETTCTTSPEQFEVTKSED